MNKIKKSVIPSGITNVSFAHDANDISNEQGMLNPFEFTDSACFSICFSKEKGSNKAFVWADLKSIEFVDEATTSAVTLFFGVSWYVTVSMSGTMSKSAQREFFEFLLAARVAFVRQILVKGVTSLRIYELIPTEEGMVAKEWEGRAG